MGLMAAFTFREAWRKKVVLIAGILTVAFLALYGTGLHFIGKNIARYSGGPADPMGQLQAILLFVTGVYMASFLVAGLAILAAVGSVSSEIENGTLYALAVRPLSRRELLLGKFLGQAAMLVTYAAIFFLALVALNYWQLGMAIPGVAPALGLFVLEPVVLLAVTMLGTVRLSTVGNGVLAFALYALAIVGGMMEQIGSMLDSTAAVYTGVVTSLILPADALYRRLVATIVDQLPQASDPMGSFVSPQNMLGPFGSLSTPSNWMLVYAGIYIVGLVAAAIYLFNRRDI